MRAMILAAGYGTRLWPLTLDRAKPALPFMGRPLVGYVAEYLARFGCGEIIVNLHHRPESVRAALGDGSDFGVRLSYIEEPVILGTSGAIDNARTFLEGDIFIVINGKLATDIDLCAALETHRRERALATLVLRRNVGRERYSTVEVEGGLVKRFGGYPAPPSDNAGSANRASVESTVKGVTGESHEEAGAGGANPESREDMPLMFTGIQILDTRIFDYIPRGIFSHSVTDVYVPAIARGERIAAHVSDGMWHELSTIQRYRDISLALMRREGRDVETGRGSVVEAGADVREAIIWEDVRVEAGARVRRAILGAGVRVGRGEVIEDAAVVRAALVREGERPEKALAGEVRGDNFVVPLAQ
ncbi:MAG: mannose-phosphate guanylyltransferase [Pyrinomonadaceae bacterium]|jgi:NDP-sugar pyrophosphorylase family protein|nr:mannose-phosphate guanylyltransferase [Pyrinomonadaceae bacterium]